MRRAGWLAMIAWLALAGCEPRAADSPSARHRLLAVGNPDNLFVAVVQDRGGAGFQFWQRDARGTWHEGGVGQGLPAAVAAWRENLLVFFASGRYGLFGIGKPIIQPSPVPSWVPVAACEDGLAADAFGWNAAGEPIHARLEDEKWSWKRVDAAIERDKVLDPCVVRCGGRLFLVWREEVPTLTGSAPTFRVRFVYLEKERWRGPVKSRLQVASAPLVASDGATMLCLFRKPSGGEGPAPWTLATYATTDEDWYEIGPACGTIPDGPLALVRSGPKFFVAAMGEKSPVVAPLDVPKAGVGEFAPFATLARPAEGPSDESSVLVLGLMMVLGLALLTAAWYRRRRPLLAAPLPVEAPAVTPAPLLRRGAALAVDYFLLYVFIMGVVQPVLFAAAPEMMERMQRSFEEAMERLLQGRPVSPADLPWPETFILEGISMGLILAYFTVAEAVFGRTAGKRLLGLEVRDETGRPMSARQAIIRNILRIVDWLPALYALGLLLALLSPRAQRLGDRLARTMVVTASPPQARDPGPA